MEERGGESRQAREEREAVERPARERPGSEWGSLHSQVSAQFIHASDAHAPCGSRNSTAEPPPKCKSFGPALAAPSEIRSREVTLPRRRGLKRYAKLPDSHLVLLYESITRRWRAGMGGREGGGGGSDDCSRFCCFSRCCCCCQCLSGCYCHWGLAVVACYV